MAATYCDTADVAAHVGFIDDSSSRQDFSGSTIPTNAEVVAYIESAQDYIDERTNAPYRTISIADEYHSIRRYGVTPIIQLNNRYIQSPLTKLEVWEGDSWNDLVQTGTEGDGVGDKDYFVDYNKGMIWLNSNYPVRRANNIRVSYDYGRTTVPEAIRLATINLVSAWIIEGAFDWVENLGEYADALSREQKAKNWRDTAERMIAIKTIPLSYPR